MTKGEQAKKYYEGGYNCAQSVIAAFAGDYGMSLEQALKIAGSFGGGMRLAATCGGLTGAMMALGLAQSGTEPTVENKSKMDTLTFELIDRWKKQVGPIDCKDILGYDIRIPDERCQAVESGAIAKNCPRCVEMGANILAKMLEELA